MQVLSIVIALCSFFSFLLAELYIRVQEHFNKIESAGKRDVFKISTGCVFISLLLAMAILPSYIDEDFQIYYLAIIPFLNAGAFAIINWKRMYKILGPQ